MKKYMLLLWLVFGFLLVGRAQNVGIGITNPMSALHIKRDNEVLRIQGATPYISFYDNAGNSKGFLQNYNDNIYVGTSAGNTTGLVQFYLNNFPTMTLEPSGGIGMGTAAPVGKLHIRHTGPSAHLILEHPSLDSYSRLLFTNAGATRFWGMAGKISSGGSQSDILSLYNSSNATEVITLTGSGNVGVGTSSPINKLQIGSTSGYSGNHLVMGNGTQAMLFNQSPVFSIWESNTDMIIAPKDGLGNIGINTNAPANKLQIGSVGNSGFATNDFAIGNGTNAVAIYQTNASTLIGSTTDIIIMPKNNGHGRVGINTNNPTASLDVTGNISTAAIYAYFKKASNTNDPLLSGTNGVGYATVSIHASDNVMALEFDARSDARIKDVVGRSNAAKDLETINALQITDYTLKDKVQNGNKPYKKVIAQQVEKVYPQVVSMHVEFIPNVYAVASKIEKKGNGYLLTFASNHHISKEAKKLKVLLSECEGMQQFDIVDIPSANEVVINATSLKTNKAFVYGEQVEDFRTVDYEGLATLNISATQELSRLVKMQQAAIEALTEEIRKMKEKPCVEFQ